jgi:hypothetical protein
MQFPRNCKNEKGGNNSLRNPFSQVFAFLPFSILREQLN